MSKFKKNRKPKPVPEELRSTMCDSISLRSFPHDVEVVSEIKQQSSLPEMNLLLTDLDSTNLSDMEMSLILSREKYSLNNESIASEISNSKTNEVSSESTHQLQNTDVEQLSWSGISISDSKINLAKKKKRASKKKRESLKKSEKNDSFSILSELAKPDLSREDCILLQEIERETCENTMSVRSMCSNEDEYNEPSGVESQSPETEIVSNLKVVEDRLELIHDNRDGNVDTEIKCTDNEVETVEIDISLSTNGTHNEEFCLDLHSHLDLDATHEASNMNTKRKKRASKKKRDSLKKCKENDYGVVSEIVMEDEASNGLLKYSSDTIAKQSTQNMTDASNMNADAVSKKKQKSVKNMEDNDCVRTVSECNIKNMHTDEYTLQDKNQDSVNFCAKNYENNESGSTETILRPFETGIESNFEVIQGKLESTKKDSHEKANVEMEFENDKIKAEVKLPVNSITENTRRIEEIERAGFDNKIEEEMAPPSEKMEKNTDCTLDLKSEASDRSGTSETKSLDDKGETRSCLSDDSIDKSEASDRSGTTETKSLDDNGETRSCLSGDSIDKSDASNRSVTTETKSLDDKGETRNCLSSDSIDKSNKDLDSDKKECLTPVTQRLQQSSHSVEDLASTDGILVQFHVLIESYHIQNESAKCVIACGNPISSWDTAVVEMKRGQTLKDGDRTYIKLHGCLAVGLEDKDKQIPYKYVVISNEKDIWEKFENDNGGDPLNRCFVITDLIDKTFNVYDDIVHLQLCEKNYQRVTEFAVESLFPKLDDLASLPLKDAWKMVVSTLVAFKNKVLLHSSDQFYVPRKTLSVNVLLNYYFKSFLTFMELPATKNSFNMVMLLCITIHDESTTIDNIQFSSDIFSVLKDLLLTTEGENPISAISNIELKEVFYHGLYKLVNCHITLYSEMSNFVKFDYGTWMFALPFLEKCLPADTTFGGLKNELLNIWKSLVPDTTRIGGLKITKCAIQKLDFKYYSDLFIEIADSTHFSTMLTDPEILQCFKTVQLLDKFCYCCTRWKVSDFPNLHNLKLYFAKAIQSKNCDNFEEWFCIFRRIIDLQPESVDFQKYILFVVIEFLNVILQERDQIGPSITEFETFLLSKVFALISYADRRTVLRDYSRLMDIYCISRNEKIVDNFKKVVNDWSDEDCISALIDKDLPDNDLLLKVILDKIFHDFSNSSKSQNAVINWFKTNIHKLSNFVHKPKLGGFLSRVILSIRLDQTVNERTCVTAMLSLINSSTIILVLDYIKELRRNITHDAEAQLKILKKHTKLFTALLKEGTLTLDTMSRLTCENGPSHLIQLLNFFKKSSVKIDMNRLITLRLKEFKKYTKERDVMEKYIAFLSNHGAIYPQQEKELELLSCQDNLLNAVCAMSFDFDHLRLNEESKIPILKHIPLMTRFDIIAQCQSFSMFLKEDTQDILPNELFNLDSSYLDIVSLSEQMLDLFGIFIKKLIDGSIQLKNVRNTLYDLFKSGSLEMEFSRLSNIYTEGDWREIGSKVNNLFEILKSTNIAKTISQIQALFSFDEEYTIVQSILSYEDDEQVFLEQSLNELLLHCRHVKEFTRFTPPLLDALKVFTKCSKLIDWMHKNIKSPQDFKVFIDLANISAGESDIDVDRVLRFQAVIMAYSSFFFEFNKESDFNRFCTACDSLLYAIERDNSIPSKLLSANQDIRWIDSIKERHGSVEASSLKAVQHIDKTGVFNINLSSTRPPISSVTLQYDVLEEDNSKETYQFNFEELKELESKLMLISIPDVQKQVVQRFTEIFHSVTRIAKQLQIILEDGCFLFSQWTLTSFMDNKKPVSIVVDFGRQSGTISITSRIEDSLCIINTFLDDCKTFWSDYMKEMRQKYPVLNYFTTNQLSHLSSALAPLKCRNSCSIDREATMLLRFMIPHLNIQDVILILKEYLDSENCDTNIEVITESTQSTCVSASRHLEGYFDMERFIDSIALEYSLEKRLIAIAIEKTGDRSNPEVIAEWCLSHHGEHTASEVSNIKIAFDSSSTDTKQDQNLCVSPKISQTEFVRNIVSKYDLDPRLVKTAIRYIGELEKEEVIVDWCLENVNGINYDSIEFNDETMSDSTWNGNSLEANRDNTDSCLTRLNQVWIDFFASIDETKTDDFVCFRSLADLLQYVQHRFDDITFNRKFPSYFTEGSPNLVVCDSNELYSFVLSLYQLDSLKPLPSLDEILICNSETSQEQIELHCLRAFQDNSGKIYSVLHADRINFEISCLVEKLCSNNDFNRSYRLVFFSNLENDDHSFISTAFELYRTSLPSCSCLELRSYLKTHLKTDMINMPNLPEMYTFTVIASSHPGNGKSLLANRIGESQLGFLKSKSLHQECIDNAAIIKAWNSSAEDTSVFHLDVTESLSDVCDDLLFSLAVARGLIDSYGYFWKCSPSQINLIELTMNKNEGSTDDIPNVSLRNLLPILWCISPQEMLEIYDQDSEVNVFTETELGFTYCMDQAIFLSENIQRPYQYLSLYNAQESLDQFTYCEPIDDKGACLSTLLAYCCIDNPTWAELIYFCRFLNVQLESCEKSVFCNSEFIEDTLPNFKNFVVKFLIIMSKDFATRSAKISDESIPVPIIKDRNRWENNPHPYIFFNADSETLSLFGFQIRNLCLLDEKRKKILETDFISEELYDGLINQGVEFNKRLSRLPTHLLRKYYIEQLALVFGITNFTPDMDEEFYQLTSDNVLKMLAIHMRFRANIPVIIMGETGTGKTRLIRFMCDLQRQARGEKNLLVLKCHGGITEHNVYSIVQKAIDLAERNIEIGISQTILFFDEANTTRAIGAIKEIMVDGLVEGNPIPGNIGLKFIAAVNPYREHSSQVIEKLENAGLGYHIRAENTTDKVGKIPMRRLVYRVREMSYSLLSLIWDFGTLKKAIEKKYIIQMIENYVSKHNWPYRMTQLLRDVLCLCQNFMHQRNDEYSFVSLRDVERALLVLVWFFDRKNIIFNTRSRQFTEKLPDVSDNFVYCVVWAIGIAYYVRLQNREELVNAIIHCFEFDEMDFCEIIDVCQDIFVNELILEKNISRNEALKENFWIMVICIELRIPLFLVGKPGSSKSLAKTIVSNIMQGNASNSPLFRKLKEIQLISFQCSPLATAEGIRSVFSQCHKFQKNQDLERFTAVVVLDEVGLAEDSPKMALKTLHPLLEDGCITDDEEPEAYKKVAFIGLSNWALDPAKMNRGVFVTRNIPTKDELIKTAIDIWSTDSKMTDDVESTIVSLVEGYCTLCEEQSREYYGLRDFYSLIKMLVKVYKINRKLLPADIVKSVARCFDGYCFSSFDPIRVFFSCVPMSEQIDQIDQKETILSCLRDEEESRYVLFLTKNNAALSIIQNYQEVNRWKNVLIIFGSSFPHDQEYTHLCQNISRIKICMEMGYTVVLCNLTNLYESLYDALNQSYVWLGNSRYVDLGLGSHRVKCRVHPSFRLIVVAEDWEVNEKFPIPLINRLEKHFLGVKTFLSDVHNSVIEALTQWVEQFASINPSNTPRDVFIGYHDDTLASIVLRAHTELESSLEDNSESLLFGSAKRVLVQCATPDSVSCLTKSKLSAEQCQEAFQIYHNEQHHDSIGDFISYYDKTADPRQLIQVTTHSRLMTGVGKTRLANQLGISPNNIRLISLQQIDTEEQFRKLLHVFLSSCNGQALENVLIIQCDLGLNKEAVNLLDCARYCIQEKVQDTKQYPNKAFTIVFLVLLARVKGGGFTGFPSSPWISVHIDEISNMSHSLDLTRIRDKSVSEILSDEHKFFTDLLIECLPKAISRASTIESKRALKSIENITSMLKDFDSFSDQFILALKTLIIDLLRKDEEAYLDKGKDWLISFASQSIDLNEGCTFQEAIWLHFVKLMVPHLEKVLVICNLDNGLDVVMSDLHPSSDRLFANFYVNTLSNLQLIDSWFNIEEIMRRKANLPNNFRAQIPFSWIYMLLFDEISRSLKAVSTSEEIQLAFENNSLSKLLDLFCDKEEHLLLLLSDIIYIKSPQSKISQDLHSVILKALRTAYVNDLKDKVDTQEISTDENCEKRKTGAIKIYQIFLKHADRVLFFTDLINIDCSILQDDLFLQNISKSNDFSLDIHGIESSISLIDPDPKKLMDFNAQQKWIKLVNRLQQLFRSYFNSVENNSSSYPKDVVEYVISIRPTLVRLDILRLFVNILLPCNSPCDVRVCILNKLRILSLSLKGGNMKLIGNFTKFVNVLTIINQTIGSLHFCGGLDNCFICKESLRDPVALECKHIACFECLRKVRLRRLSSSRNEMWACPKNECRETIQADYKLMKTTESESTIARHREIRALLNNFFIEVLQRYVFAGEIVPDGEILEFLLKFVVTKKVPSQPNQNANDTTKMLSPFATDYVDASPIVRSFVLQLVMKCSRESTRDFLQSFISSQRTFLTNDRQFTDLCLLIVHVLEDCIVNDQVLKTAQGKDILDISLIRLSRNSEIDSSSLSLMDQLLYIAEVRVDIDIVAEVIRNCIVTRERSDTESMIIDSAILLMTHCKDDHFQNYLVRLIADKYSFNFISEWKSSNIATNLLPKSLQLVQLKYSQDAFLFCGEHYLNIRNCLREALHEKCLTSIAEILSSDHHDIYSYWSYALLYFILIEENSVLVSNLPEFFHILKDRNESFGDITVRFLPDHIASDSLLSRFVTINQSHDKNLVTLLFHLHEILKSPVKFFSNSLVNVFWSIYTNSSDLEGQLFPTMPQDDDYEAMQVALQGGRANVIKYYHCPNGHRYGVGDCGQLSGTGRCNECGEVIGRGQRTGVVPIGFNQDNTQPGHILGSVQDLGAASVRVRDLSGLQVALTRFLLHGCMYLGILNNATNNMAHLIAPQPEDIGEFLFVHLRHNFNQITRSLGKSEDFAVLLLHSIFRNMAHSTEPSQGGLTSKAGRQQWEAAFAQFILQPEVERLDDHYRRFQKALNEDSTTGERVLFNILHKDDNTLTSETEIPFVSKFWHCRRRLTLDNLEQWLETNSQRATDRRRLSDICPKLYYLIENQEVLTYTSALITLIKLQTTLGRLFSGKLDACELEPLTVRQFLFDKIKNGSEREILREQIIEYLTVLSRMSTLLFNWDHYGHAARKYLTDVGLDLSNPPRDVTRWPAGLLLPCPKGYGLCAKVLVSVLIGGHNAALTADAEQEVEGDNDTEDGSGVENDVSTVGELSVESLVVFDSSQLQLLLLANLREELHVGSDPATPGVQSVVTHLDLESLERQVVDRFYNGRKPISDSRDLPVFHFYSPTRPWVPWSPALALTPLSTTGVSQTHLPASWCRYLDDAAATTRLPELCQLLSSLHTIRQLLAGGLATMTMTEKSARLVDLMQRILGGTTTTLSASWEMLETGPSTNPLTIGHLDALIDSLQVARSRQMLARRQNPWVGLLSESLQTRLPPDLPENWTNHLLHSLPGPLLLTRLHFFILSALIDISQLSNNQREHHQQLPMKAEWPLGSTLAAFLETRDDPDLALFEKAAMPEEILVEHAAACFEALVLVLSNWDKI